MFVSCSQNQKVQIQTRIQQNQLHNIKLSHNKMQIQLIRLHYSIYQQFKYLQSPFVIKSNDSEFKQSSPKEVPNIEIPNYISQNEKFTLEEFNIDRKIKSQFNGRKNTKHYTCNISAKNAQQISKNIQNMAEIQSDKNIDWHQQQGESIILDSNLYHCEWIRVKMQIYGELKILEKGKIIQFQSDGQERPDKEFYIYGTIPYNLKKLKKKKIINTSQILEIQTRRYSHKEIAIEIFCKNTKSYFFVLYEQDRRTQFLNQIKQNNFFNIVIQIKEQVNVRFDKFQNFKQKNIQKNG